MKASNYFDTNMLDPFDKEIYVTRPLLPELGDFNIKLKEIWDSQWLSNNGKQHQALEKKIKERLKVPNVCLFNNGTIALITAIQSLRLTGCQNHTTKIKGTLPLLFDVLMGLTLKH